MLALVPPSRFLGRRATKTYVRQNIGQAWTTDGEPAELAAGSICHSLFPGLTGVYRCCLHSGQKSLEASLQSDPLVESLLSLLVTRLSDNSGLGSLARALHRSPKLKAKLKEIELRDLDHLAELTQLGRQCSAAAACQEASRVRFCLSGRLPERWPLLSNAFQRSRMFFG